MKQTVPHCRHTNAYISMVIKWMSDVYHVLPICHVQSEYLLLLLLQLLWTTPKKI